MSFWVKHAATNIAYCLLVVNGGSSYFRMYNYVGSDLIDSGTFTIVADTWYCIEYRIKIDSNTGIMQAWIDETQKINYTELNTGTNNVTRVLAGAGWAWEAVNYYMDSIVVADTYIGPVSETQTFTRTWQTDILFKKLGIQKALNIDTTFQKQNISKTFTLDAAFQKRFTLQKQIDALFQRLEILETFGLDVDLLKRDVAKSFALDARFSALAIHTVSRQIDLLLKKLDATKNFSLGVYFGVAAAETYGKAFGLDAIFAYKVRLPELWLDENGKMVLNLSKPYTWVGS
jgi:hypothetical protein